MKRTVLIVTNSGDIHTDDLVASCRRQDVECFRYNTDHFRLRGSLSYDTNEDAILNVDSRTCRLSDVDLLIYRRPEAVHRKRKDIERWAGALLDHEWQTTEQALSYMITGRVMNPIGASAIAQNKLIQLQLANHHGLKTPNTLVSSEINSLNRFLDNHPCVTKGISNSGYLFDGVMRGATTTHVTKNDIASLPLQGCITMVQERIFPVAMWRIITIGQKSFGFRLTGDVLNECTDSRKHEDVLHGGHAEIPLDVKENLRNLCEDIGLLYASSDFIEDQKGDLWFIDLNPEGQWGAYEHRFGIPISDEIIALAKAA